MSGIRTLADLRDRCVVDEITGCWLWHGALCGSTPSMRIPALGRNVGAGIAICYLTTGKEPEAGVVWHRTCRTITCACPEHRMAGTRKTQMAFMSEIAKSPLTRGRIARARRAQSPISDEVVLDIRNGEGTGSEMAAKHGISITHACRIRRQETRRPIGVSAFSSWGPLRGGR